MKKHKILILSSVFGLALATICFTQIVNAEETANKPKKQEVIENRQAIQDAIKNNDYKTWKTLVGDRPAAEKITETNWSKYVEMHSYFDKAKALRDELGLPAQKREMRGNGNGKGLGNKMPKAVLEALNSGDYDAWVKAIGEKNPHKDKITKDNFSKFAEAHKLMQAGKPDEAAKIFDELGLKAPGQKNFPAQIKAI